MVREFRFTKNGDEPAEEMIELGDYFFAQEYFCAFLEAVGHIFSDASIDAAFHDAIAPLFADEADDGSLVELPALLAGV